MSFFVLDIECGAIESTTVVFSVAMVYVEPELLSADSNKAYRALIDTSFLQNACMIKFKSVEQTKPPYNRITDKGTMEWWKNKTGDVQRKASFLPSAADVSVPEGFAKLREWYDEKRNKQELPIWIRGTLDQMALDSLCNSYGLPYLARYNVYRDVRTAIDLLYPSGSSGYVEIPGFDKDVVIKHHPVHDCAYDGLMLLRGKQD
jgi:hypothetical protein